MTMNMKQWVADVIASDKKEALPVLSFPSIQKMGITVAELINSSDKQAEGMKIIADSCPTAASVDVYKRQVYLSREDSDFYLYSEE